MDPRSEEHVHLAKPYDARLDPRIGRGAAPLASPSGPTTLATELASQATALEELDRMVNVLSQRIDPFLRGGSSRAEDPRTPVPPVLSAVGTQVCGHNHRIRRLIETVEDLVNRVDLS